MKLHNPDAGTFVPDGAPLGDALDRITHLGIGAHQDDLEIMAFHGILQCVHNDKQWFGGVTCTSGAGSPRSGPYADYSDEEMRDIRRREQNIAATIGQYGIMMQLDYDSEAVKDPNDTRLREDLKQILRATHPSVVYTHNPADKHDTHVAIAANTILAIREIPKAERPQTVYGCEVWRNLDWMLDGDKVPLDVRGHESLAAALVGVFDSQIAGGKRYDLATLGRRQANARYLEPHAVDESEELWFAMDLSPLVHNETLDIVDYVETLIRHFADDVRQKLNECLGRG
ncbi:MAG: PIG-L family deacetylase [Kiritimatiellae bacterium]|nr:PIG-L family deacetylase [Kiritimatiellia bacterium]